MSPQGERANRRILIVDDTASIHQDFRKILCAETIAEQTLESIEQSLFGTSPTLHQSYSLDSAFIQAMATGARQRVIDRKTRFIEQPTPQLDLRRVQCGHLGQGLERLIEGGGQCR